MPKYVVLCVLFMLAFHIKLQSMTDDSSTRTYRYEGEIQDAKLIDLPEIPEAKKVSEFKKATEIKKAQKVEEVVEFKKEALPLRKGVSFYVNIQNLIRQKQRVVRDIFSNHTNTGFLPNPKVESANCRKLLAHDEDEIEITTFKQENETRIPTSDRSYIFDSQRCQEFITNRQYITKSVDDEEANFSIAFSILMFKDVEQTERLLRMIYRPQNYYCIHVDFKSPPETYEAISSIAECFPNVILASHRSDVRWGEFSVLEPDLTCMKDLLKWRWKYFINLTGQEMPLKTNYQLVQILSVFNGANDVECIKR